MTITLATLIQKLNAAREVARGMVDAELHEHGYDSLRFADYRAGWLSLETRLDTILWETPVVIVDTPCVCLPLSPEQSTKFAAAVEGLKGRDLDVR